MGLVLDQVEIRHGNTVIVAVDQKIAPGEVLTVMGPSGAGKSTLLNYVIGRLSNDFSASGAVVLDGIDITRLSTEQRRIGILFQDDLLFPHMSVAQNLSFGLRPEGGRADRSKKIESALAEIGLVGFGDRDPTTLSGGQKVRVAMMRMLLSEPRALLLDEPFSKLDMALRDQMRALVFGMARQRSLPVLMVSHDMADAVAAGGQILNLRG
jgi:putative thiamine transport system ATP-binding protein